MNSQENPNWKRRLEELEAQVEKNSPAQAINTQPGQPLQRHTESSPAIPALFKQLTNWFSGLSGIGKVIAIAIVVILGFSLIKSVLQLVISLFSIALLGVVLYLVYKFWVAPQSPK